MVGCMTNLGAIIKQLRSKAANRKSKFISYVADLETELLARQYREIMEQAPKRHQRGKKYLFERSGIPSSGEISCRLEEHLAMALYNKFRAPRTMRLPDGRELEILDYQTPLKAVLSDGGVGKVDLVGVIDGERLAVLELKVKGGDTPVAATLEALVYAAILEANIEDIGKELASHGYAKADLERLEIIVLGPADYWQEFNQYDEAWLDKITPGLTRIARSLSLDIQFVELETGRLEMGLEGLPPELDGDVVVRTLYCSTAPSGLIRND